jgi:hypothetical protein
MQKSNNRRSETLVIKFTETWQFVCSINVHRKGVHKSGTVLEDAVEPYRTAKVPGNGRRFGISRVWARLTAYPDIIIAKRIS